MNRTGTDGKGIAYAGDSRIHDHLGETLADLGSSAGQCTVTLSLEALHRYREKFPAFRDADDFTLP